MIEEIKKTSVVELDKHWTFIVKGHSDHYIVGQTDQRLKNIPPNTALIMQQPLDMTLKNPQVVLRANHQWVFVYIGEKLIYSYDATNKQSRPGLLQTTIHLPDNYRQQKLRVVTKTPYDYYSGIPAQIFIGEAAAVNRFFILHALPQFLLFSLCLTLIALMFAVICLKPAQSKKQLLSSLLLIGFIFLIGLQSLALNVPASALFDPITLSTLYNLTSILIPVFLTSYYWLRTNKYRQYYLYGVGLQILLLIFGLVSLAVGKLSLPVAMQIFSGFNVFMTLFTSAIALAESANDNRFYTICSPAIIMAAFVHCFFYIKLFAGSANLTTDWPLILFSGLMILISGYHITEEISVSYYQRVQQQKQLEQGLIMREKQKNLLETFNLMAEKEADEVDQTPSLTHFLYQMENYYQKKFRKQAKFFSCQFLTSPETKKLDDEKLTFLIQLFEKFLTDPIFGTIDISIQQKQDQLVIESKTSTLARHSFDQFAATSTMIEPYQELEQAVKRSNGQWQWQEKEKQQYFKIILDL